MSSDITLPGTCFAAKGDLRFKHRIEYQQNISAKWAKLLLNIKKTSYHLHAQKRWVNEIPCLCNVWLCLSARQQSLWNCKTNKLIDSQMQSCQQCFVLGTLNLGQPEIKKNMFKSLWRRYHLQILAVFHPSCIVVVVTTHSTHEDIH